MATSTVNTNKPILPRGADVRPIDSYNRAALYSGKALDFDGVNDYVDLDGFTMAGNVATIVFQAKFSNGAYLFDINNQRFVVLNDTTNGLSVYNSNAWSYYGETIRGDIGFYAIVSDGTTQRAYYNGVQLGNDATITALDWDSITEMALGSNNNGTGNFFGGQIAGFKIFNTALTAAKIADLYNNPEKIVPTGVDNTALKLWLPMMEGAGTTAINGAPDALGSEEVTNGDFATDSDWTKSAGWTIANGKATFDNSSGAGNLTQTGILEAGKTYVLTFDTLEVGGGNFAYGLGGLFVFINDIEANTTYAVIATASTTTLNLRGADNFTGSIDNVSVKEISNIGTISGATWTNGIGAPVAQTSVIDWNKHTLDGTNEVLVPQGLTSGRDLLDNLFENVRKQGALNLDGNSWAEVHDNASLDFGTGSFSLEAWVKAKYTSSGSVYNAFLTLGGDIVASNNCGLALDSSLKPYIIYNTNASVGPIQNEGDWVHIVGNYDGTKATLYVNGSQVDQDTISAGTITNANTKMIGKGASTNRFYKDQIAQPRIYNRALTAEEVLKNYNATSSLYI